MTDMLTARADDPAREYMDCFAKHGFLFVHIPRTGGTTFEHCFGVRSMTFHLRAQYYRGLSRYGATQPDLVSIVRHPHDRMKSVYRFLMSAGEEVAAALRQDVRNRGSFESFCLNIPELLRRHNTVFLWPQWSFLQIQGLANVDTTLRYERFGDDVATFLKGHGLANDVALPRIRATAGKVIVEDTFLARAAIERWYKTDFCALGYSTQNSQ